MVKNDDKISRIEWLRAEVRRISKVTLAGTFAKPEDREFWVNRVRKLNLELSALEQQVRPRRLGIRA